MYAWPLQVAALPSKHLAQPVLAYALLVRADAYDTCGFHQRLGVSSSMAVTLLEAMAKVKAKPHPARTTFQRCVRLFDKPGFHPSNGAPTWTPTPP